MFRQFNRERIVFSTSSSRTTGCPYAKRRGEGEGRRAGEGIDTYLASYIKINLNGS